MTTTSFTITAGAAEPLGVTSAEGGVNIAVVSSNATRIEFCVFDDNGQTQVARLQLPGRSGEVFHGFVPGLGDGTRYGLRADGPYEPSQGHRFDPAMLLADPYAVEFDRPFAYHTDLGRSRADARDTAALMPKAIVRRPLPNAVRPPQRALGFVYEVMVKAFTKLHPDVPEALRGTVAALAHPAVISHFKRIGADTIELMPLAAWIDERHLLPLGLSNAWGYNPVTFLAPDPRLAPGGMREIRDTLEKLHAEGFRVVLDVVFNHSGEADDRGSTLSMRGLDNALYYRHAADDPGKPINDTGCGNTLALDRPPLVRLAMDALHHWVRAGFDGFRFDLATVLGRLPDGFSPHAPLLQAMASDPMLAGTALIAEPWDVGPGGYRLGEFPKPWAEWNGRYRDAARRFWRGDPDAAGEFATAIAGSSDLFEASGRAPSHSVNFIAAHDGFPLADLTAFTEKHNGANGENNRDGTSDNLSWNCGREGPTDDPSILAARAADVRALLATIVFSRGTPMITAGDEFGRSQLGNNNAYAQDNAVTWLDWISADNAMTDHLAHLVRLRKSHPALHADRFLTGSAGKEGGLADAVWLKRDGQSMTDGDWREPSADLLGLALFESGAAGDTGAAGDRVCLYFNRTQETIEVTLPLPRQDRSWQLDYASSGDAAAVHDGKFQMTGRSVALVSERS